MEVDRRQFAAGALASLAFAGLGRQALAAGEETYRNEVAGYGALVADPQGLLDLPQGFTYRVISMAGEAMDDGYVVPDKFDGMGCLPLDETRVALVRNHELKPEDLDRGPTGGSKRLLDRLRGEAFFGADMEGRPLPGGNSTIIYNMRSGQRESQYLSLAGTAVNCAGGVTPWGSWLSCEETVLKPSDGLSKSHGWVFDVPARHRGLAKPIPLKAMGRFRHEAAAVDPYSGIVYLTEDRDDGLFYRFLPDDLGRIGAGGRLQALALRDLPSGGDTRNWQSIDFQPGTWKEAFWVDVNEVEAPDDDLRLRGHKKGAALFARGEGIHRGAGEYYFTCTSGGSAKIGQIMRYVPSLSEGRAGEREQPGRLQLFVESRSSQIMDYADNLTVAPWGHLIICEDRGEDGAINHLKGITPEGRVYTIARLKLDTELAGACFSPDGSILFVNAYAPGKTLAISGPWASVRSV